MNEILRARDKAGKKLSIGFQMCYDTAMRALKSDVDAGVFWRAGFAARDCAVAARDQYPTIIVVAAGLENGTMPRVGRFLTTWLSNATAHYLMNMALHDGRAGILGAMRHVSGPIRLKLLIRL